MPWPVARSIAALVVAAVAACASVATRPSEHAADAPDGTNPSAEPAARPDPVTRTPGPPADLERREEGTGWYCHRVMGGHSLFPCFRTVNRCEGSRQMTDPSGTSVGPCDAYAQAHCVTWHATVQGHQGVGLHCLPSLAACEEFKTTMLASPARATNVSRCDVWE